MNLLIKANPKKELIHFSDGQSIQKWYKNGTTLFLKIGKIDLYADLNERIALFSNMLVAGIPFDSSGKYPKIFEESDMGHYLPLLVQSIIDIKKEMERIKQTDTIQGEYDES